MPDDGERRVRHGVEARQLAALIGRVHSVPGEGRVDGVSTEAATEVLAYLVSAARTQLDEAAEYAPMRLLTAAQRLAAALPEEAPGPVRDLVAALGAIPPTATPTADRTAYIALVDDLCTVLADCLLAQDPPSTDPVA